MLRRDDPGGSRRPNNARRCHQARKKLEEDGTPIPGTILNDWNTDSNGFSYGNKYYDWYFKYYRADERIVGRMTAEPLRNAHLSYNSHYLVI